MHKIFVYIQPEFPKKFRTTSKHCRRCSDDFQPLLKIPRDVLMISEGCWMSWCKLNQCDLVSLLFRTQMRHIALFTGLFWWNWIEFFTVMVNEQVAQNFSHLSHNFCTSGVRSCPVWEWSMFLIHRHVTHIIIMYVSWQVYN